MSTEWYTLSLDSFTINNTRSRHRDTDYVTISVAVPGQPTLTQTRAMGDLNNGTFNPNLAFQNVAVDDDQPAVFSYIILNDGHTDPSEVEKNLKQAASQLANVGAQAAAQAIGDAIGTAVGAAVGTALGGLVGTATVPVIGSALGAVAGFVVSEVEKLLDPNCDGPVAAGVHVFLGSQLRAATHNGGVLQTTDHNPGVDSAAGCGNNSDYDMNWKVGRSAVTHSLRFAATMAPANEPFQWWYGLTGQQVGQKVQASGMQLRNLSAYVDRDDNLKFAAVMGPHTGAWWWYWGQTGEQVGSLLQHNKAQLADISPYVGPDGALRFAVIMVPAKTEWWWYWGQTAEQVSSLIQQNKAVLSKISPYWERGALKLAVIMERNVGQTWWWWWGQTGEEVASLQQKNKAVLTDIAAYVDHSDSVRFAVLMKPPTGPWPGWWFGLDADGIAQKITSTNARPAELTPYFV